MIDQVRPFAGFDYVQNGIPAFDVNPGRLGATWVNLLTGEIFICVQANTDDNIWVGQFKSFAGKDSYWASVALLLHFNGTPGSTQFLDSSENRHVVTSYGNAVLGNADSKFGGMSGQFDGSGDYLTIPSDPIFEFGSGDFTIEGWINSVSPTAALDDFIVCNNYPSWYSYSWALSRSIGNGGRLSFYAYGVGLEDSSSLPAGWSHVAVTREGSNFKLFKNGVIVATATSSASITDGTTNGIVVGTSLDGTGVSFNGNMDDLRITKGVARYTANFAVPTETFASPDLYIPNW